MRAACAQRWEEHVGACALQLGMVESAAALDAHVVHSLFNGDVREAWRQMRAWRAHAVVHGLAPRRGGAAAAEQSGAAEQRGGLDWDFDEHALAAAIVDLAAEGLRGRGRGEEVYLASVASRLEARVNPGQAAIALRNSIGSDLLIRSLAVQL